MSVQEKVIKNKGRPAKILLFMALIPSLLLSGCLDGSTSITVKTAEAGIKALEINVEVDGALAPEEPLKISAKMGGKVKSEHFEVGDTVKKGQTLITLDTSELNVQLAAAQKSYNNAQVRVEEARGSMETTRNNLERMQSLYDEGAIPLVQVQRAQSDYDNAKAEFDAASGTPLSRAKATLDNVSAQFANANVTSPIDGVIITKNIHVGEVASPGVALGTVANISILKLKGAIAQDIFPFLEIGQKMDIEVDAYPENAYEGIITLLGPISVGTGSYFPIELTLANPGELAAGMAATSSILVTSDIGIVVPSAAIVKEDSEVFVYVIEEGVAHKRKVKLGFSNEDDVEITEGVKQSEFVAVTNVNKLRDNRSVTVEED